MFFNVFQMALWLPNTGKVYLPPQKPVPRVLSTDEYITRTQIYFHAASERLLTVGHPYFPIHDAAENTKINIPKVSGSQYRVWRVKLPDPNRFALIDQTLYNPDAERLVWGLRGLELTRGGPLGVGATGHPLYNKAVDTENPSVYPALQSKDNRMNVSVDPKQTQLLMVGCVPPVGCHWDAAKPCNEKQQNKGDCPLLELVHSTIEDGNMCDIGYGAMNYKTLCQDRASVPLDIVNEVVKWPDFTQMTKDVYGDQLFFFARREQVYARHMGARDGTIVDTVPHENNEYYVNPQANENGAAIPQTSLASHTYYTQPSGSLVSSDAQVFNRPYWMHRAQGPNNGICWNNELFVTCVDNTHNTNFSISVYSGDNDTPTEYKSNEFRQYLRHAEEYGIELIVQLCKVPLDADILAHLNVMNPDILESWNLAFVPPPPQGMEDTYRYLHSLAVKCPLPDSEKSKEDPYKNLSFWTIDLTDKFSSDLSQVSFGRRFLYQMGLLAETNVNSLKRARATISSPKQRKSAKRRRVGV